MIGRLRGEILLKDPPLLLLDLSGVGYEIELPTSCFKQLPVVGETTTLHIHMVVREDAQLLYGFTTIEQRSLFRALIKVNGVGPKLALTLLSGIEVSHFVRAVRNGDSSTLVRLPGVGKKTAERLIVEMADKLDEWLPTSIAHSDTASDFEVFGEDLSTPSSDDGDPVEDAISALIALGYKPPVASRLISQVAMDGLNSEDMIRSALKLAMKQQ
ncbi:MAG: Holliday junction branch migration protein RuvA [Gammaproteobacteria bacterium]|nr:Holliday junction branch migration protein RuvA [Gammaproteobacteria bacterium]